MLHTSGNKHDDNEEFYAAICELYFVQVYEFCLHLIKDRTKFYDFVEDCTQETFLEARKQINKLKNHPNIKGWLYVTARNLVYKSFRKYYTKGRYEILLEEDDLPCTAKKVEEEVEKAFEDSIDVYKLKGSILRQLSKAEHELYRDYFVKKISVAEISRKYHISTTAATTRIYRLRKQIKLIMNRLFQLRINLVYAAWQVAGAEGRRKRPHL